MTRPAPPLAGACVEHHGGRRELHRGTADAPITVGRVFPAQIRVRPRISRNHLRLEITRRAVGGRRPQQQRRVPRPPRRAVGDRHRRYDPAPGSTRGHCGHLPLGSSAVPGTTAGPTRDADGASDDESENVDDGDDDDGFDDESGETTGESGYIDPGVVRAGAAVASRRRELDIAQRALAKDKVVNAGTLIAFEKGRSWPRQSTLARLEEALRWEPGTISRIRWGEDPNAARPGSRPW